MSPQDWIHMKKKKDWSHSHNIFFFASQGRCHHQLLTPSSQWRGGRGAWVGLQRCGSQAPMHDRMGLCSVTPPASAGRNWSLHSRRRLMIVALCAVTADSGRRRQGCFLTPRESNHQSYLITIGPNQSFHPAEFTSYCFLRVSAWINSDWAGIQTQGY